MDSLKQLIVNSLNSFQDKIASLYIKNIHSHTNYSICWWYIILTFNVKIQNYLRVINFVFVNWCSISFWVTCEQILISHFKSNNEVSGQSIL